MRQAVDSDLLRLGLILDEETEVFHQRSAIRKLLGNSNLLERGEIELPGKVEQTDAAVFVFEHGPEGWQGTVCEPQLMDVEHRSGIAQPGFPQMMALRSTFRRQANIRPGLIGCAVEPVEFGQVPSR